MIIKMFPDSLVIKTWCSPKFQVTFLKHKLSPIISTAQRPTFQNISLFQRSKTNKKRLWNPFEAIIGGSEKLRYDWIESVFFKNFYLPDCNYEIYLLFVQQCIIYALNLKLHLVILSTKADK